MTRFDSVVIGSELVSEHYLAEEFAARVRSIRATWAEQEEFAKKTPRKGLTALSSSLAGDLVSLREATGVQRNDLLRRVYARIRDALGLEGTRSTWAFERAGDDLAVSAVVHRTPSGPHLVILEANDAATVEDILDGAGAGHLLDPLTHVDCTGGVQTQTTKVVSALFLATHPTPPALVVVQAGGWLLVAERTRWAEGRWLAVDLSTAADRRDVRASGELETIAALIGSDALLPADDGSCGFTDMLTASVTHAVGVSKDLRDGVRESIEVICTEVLRRRRAHGIADDATPDLSKVLTRHALRYLYRILFLLYAEARPELGVLPVGSPEYSAGYGLDRLRDLCLVGLTTERAQAGQHLYLSLAQLFMRVDQGYAPPDGGDDALVFEALRADLFKREATALIDEVGLGNEALQAVLTRLLLSRKQAKRERGFVSYAQLGINQLGAVYEGLMSYTGFLAWDELCEVAKDGDPDKGSWLVPVKGFDQSGIDPANLVVHQADSGEKKPNRYARGDYVLRLSGRDRQRSASYYTPQVLTACVVRHSLAELLDQPDPDDPEKTPRTTPAADLLRLRICEPALGSGAFLVEALDQIAAEYLTRAQAEAGKTIDPEQYPAEVQKVKAYLALHCCYGVDLNDTAVELAEISLWLSSMHPGLQAPWFGLRLRRGNSLIGARRAFYSPSDYAKALWWKTVPVDRALSDLDGDGRMRDGEVHHFLLPAEGWGAVADTKEAKELRETETLALKEWRKAVRRAPSKTEAKRLTALARRAETLWQLATTRLEIAEAESRRDIDVWGATDLPLSHGSVSREQIEESLADENGAYRRLRRVMDAWAALWFWPVTAEVKPPGWEQWIDALEGLLGKAIDTADGTDKTYYKRKPGLGQEDFFVPGTDWAALAANERVDLELNDARSVEEVLQRFSWLDECARISEKEGFFHWALDFAPVFAGGGFDLQIGNPPWVRPDWDDDLVLAEEDAWFQLANKVSIEGLRRRRSHLLQDPKAQAPYLAERASQAGTAKHLGSKLDRPLLGGTQPDLYRCFLDRIWRLTNSSGIVGLIHQDSHLTEARALSFRLEAYQRLRRHWHFCNELRLFDIEHTREFSVSIYAHPKGIEFQSACILYHPLTLENSLIHNGEGEVPGVKDDAGDWDRRAHRERIIVVNEGLLSLWAELFEDARGALAPRFVWLITSRDRVVLQKLSKASRFQQTNFAWSSGWHEKADRVAGYLEPHEYNPTSLSDLILLGPHITPATPFGQYPHIPMRHVKDYIETDFESISSDWIPSSIFRHAMADNRLQAKYGTHDGRPVTSFWRLAWREMVDTTTSRTLAAAMIPPETRHLGTIFSAIAGARDLAIAAGLWSSLPLDFLVKVSGKGHVKADLAGKLPHVFEHPLLPSLLLRTMRLNCLTEDFTPLWSEIFDLDWLQDSWTTESNPIKSIDWVNGLSNGLSEEWNFATPLRTEAERRQALVELDALAAIMLGLSCNELCAIYRSQFGVLRNTHERKTRYDLGGRKVPGRIANTYKAWSDSGSQNRKPDFGSYVPPFVGLDREVDMTRAHNEFSRRLAERTAQADEA